MSRSKLSSTFLIVAALCAASLAAAGPLREDFDQTYTVAADGRVSLENVNGSVQVAVWDRNAVRVQAVKEADTREDLENLRIEVTESPSALRIVTRLPQNDERWGGHRHLSVEYTLTVPRGATLDKIDLVNGSLTVSGLKGGLRAELVNGDLEATALAGDVRVETVNGRTEVEVDATVGGQRIELESVNGTVELRLPAGASATVHAETVNGGIDNDFGLEVRKDEIVGREMDGRIGAGAADIRLETVNGRVRLVKK